MTAELRAPTLEDLPALIEFFDGLRSRYDVQVISEEELRNDLGRRQQAVAENYRIALDDGRVSGWVSVWFPEGQRDRGYFTPRALPRDGRLYAQLLDWVEGRLRSIGGGGPMRAQASAEPGDEPLLEELRGRGYERARHFFEMEIDLADEPEQPRWPEGLALRAFEPEDARRVYDANMEAFEDHWDPFHVGFEEWRDFFLGRPDFDPELWFLAEDEDELAGFSLCSLRDAGTVGWVHVLGVRRPWRRRGLATALLLQSFRALRAKGCAKARLNVDGENLTGAVRLYEQAGMHVARRSERHSKELC
jgi:ribosomal protein S18 acetylase RimI-like enzyme